MKLRSNRVWLLAVVLGLSLVAGCGNKINGKYQDQTGMYVVVFNGGKADITIMGVTQEVNYDQDGDKIVLHSPQGDFVLTRQSDGTLTGGPEGTLTKQAS